MPVASRRPGRANLLWRIGSSGHWTAARGSISRRLLLPHSITRQKLDELKVEELLASARDKKAQLDAERCNCRLQRCGCWRRLREARCWTFPVRSATRCAMWRRLTCRKVRRFCARRSLTSRKSAKCRVTGQAAEPMTTSVAIEQTYLAWAQDAAPQIVGWSSYTSTVQQQAVISATALYSQALALNPPSDTPVYVWIAPGAFDMGSTDEQVTMQ